MVEKIKTTYACQECGIAYAKWQGQCEGCKQWNTIVEEKIPTASSVTTHTPLVTTMQSATQNKAITQYPKPLAEIDPVATPRLRCADQELNRVLGGGIVPGSMVLMGGEPGIGKSTLLLQLALELTHKKILYVSGEESEVQIKMRAQRIGTQSTHCYILHETNLKSILHHAQELAADLLIIDSIQTTYAPYVEAIAGSITQVRACTHELMQYAKQTQVPVFLIGHINKEGAIAGPKVLEHMVDTVLQFEGDHNFMFRILRTIKNRFGATSELGIYEMQAKGLQPVTNPSEILLSQPNKAVSGIAVGTSLEGRRPLLMEVQALVSPATYGTPQRSTTGFDAKRLNMLLAVLEKKSGCRLGNQDVFLNIVGGLKVTDPAIDLAVCLAIASSWKEVPLPTQHSFIAEVGLSGELRPVSNIEERITEAAKLGFKHISVANQHYQKLPIKKWPNVNIQPFETIQQIIKPFQQH